MPPQIACASALPGKKEETRKSRFHSNAVSVLCLNSTSCLISSIFLTQDSYSQCNQCVQPAGLLGAWFWKKAVESAAWVGLCCMHSAPVRCLLGFLFRKVMQKHYRGEVEKQCRLISYFRSNTYSKSYHNRIVSHDYNQRGDIFWDMVYFDHRCNKHQLSLTNPRDALHHGKCAASKGGRSGVLNLGPN